jgi:hypothetical protein
MDSSKQLQDYNDIKLRKRKILETSVKSDRIRSAKLSAEEDRLFFVML